MRTCRNDTAGATIMSTYIGTTNGHCEHITSESELHRPLKTEIRELFLSQL